MDLLEKVNQKIAENRAEMVSSLSTLISIPSVAEDNGGEHPFGENVHRAYEVMMDMADKAGFGFYNADNYGGHIDFRGSEEGIVGVVGHIDVVPEGEGWDFDPYGGEIIDGNICGRGTTDDKGPVIASFYAMKALKECGYEPKRTIRLILGLDEETNWKGMDYYVKKVDRLPDMGFTPDADFPAIHGEKGIIVFDLARKFSSSSKGLELSSLTGGNAANMVADHARAVVYDSTDQTYGKIKEVIDAYREASGHEVKGRKLGKSFEILTKGVSAHGAKPSSGLNAISIMMELLGGLNFACDDVNDFIAFYNDHIGYDVEGERIGCADFHDVSGNLVFNVGMIEAGKKDVKLTINVRYPVTYDDGKVYDAVTEVIKPYDIGIVKGKNQDPVWVEEDDPLIVTLMDIYRRRTGDTESEPLIIGGGTYARAMDNIVAFGARFPEAPELEHQKNELISIDSLVKITEIYAEAVYRLSELD